MAPQTRPAGELNVEPHTPIEAKFRLEFTAMNHILLIIGSPASSKSNIAKEIAKRSTKGVHIPVDDLRTMVHGGAIHPGVPGWPPELVQQLELARQTAIDMALRYCEADFLIAIDDFWDSHSHLQEYAPLINRAKVTQVILRPSVSVTIARNHARQAPSTFRNLLDDAIKSINAELDKHEAALIEQGWHILDTSNDTIEESVARTLALLETSAG